MELQPSLQLTLLVAQKQILFGQPTDGFSLAHQTFTDIAAFDQTIRSVGHATNLWLEGDPYGGDEIVFDDRI